MSDFVIGVLTVIVVIIVLILNICMYFYAIEKSDDKKSKKNRSSLQSLFNPSLRNHNDNDISDSEDDNTVNNPEYDAALVKDEFEYFLQYLSNGHEYLKKRRYTSLYNIKNIINHPKLQHLKPSLRGTARFGTIVDWFYVSKKLNKLFRSNVSMNLAIIDTMTDNVQISK